MRWVWLREAAEVIHWLVPVGGGDAGVETLRHMHGDERAPLLLGEGPPVVELLGLRFQHPDGDPVFLLAQKLRSPAVGRGVCGGADDRGDAGCFDELSAGGLAASVSAWLQRGVEHAGGQVGERTIGGGDRIAFSVEGSGPAVVAGGDHCAVVVGEDCSYEGVRTPMAQLCGVECGLHERFVAAGVCDVGGAQWTVSFCATPIQTLTVGTGFSPVQPVHFAPGRGLSPPVRIFTDPVSTWELSCHKQNDARNHDDSGRRSSAVSG